VCEWASAMKGQPISSSATNTKEIDNRWGLYSGLLAALLVMILILYWETTSSMVQTWWVAETYTHGFLILPISLWLIWQRKTTLSLIQPSPVFWPLLPLIFLGLVWLLADIVDVLVVQQLTVVAMLILSAWTVIGTQVVRAVTFPLGFLFFAVPMGESLVPPMMEYTATVLVALVKITGIPVYRDGMFIALPSGNWSVVDACSGVRYLIASTCLGCLFAYLNYGSLRKRLIFILISAIVPVIANGLRAYMIVMIGHVSDMTLAVGVDHLIYGWVFFGLVMFILFFIGAKWRDTEEQPEGVSASQSKKLLTTRTANVRSLVAGICSVVLASSVWPLLAWSMNQPLVNKAEDSLNLAIPESVGHWEVSNHAQWDWKSKTVGADLQVQQFYVLPQTERAIALYLARYASQRQGSEVVNVQNDLYNASYKHWRLAGESIASVSLHQNTFNVREVLLKSNHQDLLAWHWYRIGADYTEDNYLAKLFEIKAQLVDRRRDAAIITVVTEFNGSSDLESELQAARSRLNVFVSSLMPQLEADLDSLVGSE